MKTLKKSLALILALVMCLSLCAVPAFADDVNIITDVNSTEAQAWKAYTKSVPTDYGTLTEGSFFIAKFTQAEMAKAKTPGSGFYVEITTDSSEGIEGYIGQYASGSTKKNLNLWWPVIQSPATSTYYANISSSVSLLIGANSLSPMNFSDSASYFAVGFSLKTAITSDTKVTITLLDSKQTTSARTEAGIVIASRTYTFQPSQQPQTPDPDTKINVNVLGFGPESYKSYENTFLNQTFCLKAVVTGDSGTEAPTWTTSNDQVASVMTVAEARENGDTIDNKLGSSDAKDTDAYVTIKGTGTATITARIGKSMGTYSITIINEKPAVATVGDNSYDSLNEAVKNVVDTGKISITNSIAIGSTFVKAGSTVTVTTEDEVSIANSNATTVTPKTLTISKDGEADKTVKAYVVSSGSGENEKKAVVTNVDFGAGSNITNQSSTTVENLVNVAQVLANAVAANATGDSPIDVGSISSMTLRLDKTDNTASATLTGTDNDAKSELQTKLSNGSVTVYDVKPIATVITATTTGGTTSTQTYEYDASKEVTGTFKFKLNVGTSADAGKTANLTHYHEDSNGTWTATPITGIVDNNGDVTVTLSQFSYISVDNMVYSFPTAVDAAQPGDTITLSADVTLESTVVIEKNLIIDLNGHNITAADCRALWVKSGDVTITGNGTVTSGTASSTFGATSSVIRVGDAAANANVAKLTIGKNVTVTSTYCYGITVFGKNAADSNGYGQYLVVNGTVTVSGSEGAISSNGSSGLTNPQLTINDGATVTSDGDVGIYLPAGKLIVDGGTITGATGIYFKSTDMTINGGTITGNGANTSYSFNGDGCNCTGDALVIDNCNYPKGVGTVEVKGGTFNSTNASAVGSYKGNGQENELTGFVSGGTFSSALPAAYCAAGYTTKLNDDGTYGVRAKNGYDANAVYTITLEAPATIDVEQNDAKFDIDVKLTSSVAKNLSSYQFTLDIPTGFTVSSSTLPGYKSGSNLVIANLSGYKSLAANTPVSIGKIAVTADKTAMKYNVDTAPFTVTNAQVGFQDSLGDTYPAAVVSATTKVVTTYETTWNFNGGKLGNETSKTEQIGINEAITAPVPVKPGYTLSWTPTVADTATDPRGSEYKTV